MHWTMDQYTKKLISSPAAGAARRMQGEVVQFQWSRVDLVKMFQRVQAN